MTDTWQRCFIALTPDAATRKHLASLPIHPKARRENMADLHLTLAFVGALAPDQARRLGDALPTMAGALPMLAFGGLERWPSGQRPRVEVATFALPQALAAMSQALRSLLQEMALPLDSRPFRPHFTLARFRHGIGESSHAVAAVAPFSARVDALSLYARSPNASPGVAGPRYALLASAELKA